jgi:two-component system, OmpR family, response regulator
MGRRLSRIFTSLEHGRGAPRTCPGDASVGPTAKGGWLTPEHPSKGTVLLVEDEASIADLVRLYLERDGFRVVWRTDGPSGLAAVDAERPRLVLLDLMLPGMDGFEVTRALRQRGGRVPIIVVTAREEEADRVLGLELGADDYVTKPFSPRELVARVKAVLRRTEPAPEAGPEPPLHLGSLTVDPARHEVAFEGRPVQLTAREFELLSYLVRNRGLVLTRDQILERVWGYSFPADTRTVDVHIRQLRAKLGDHAPIVTIRGVGYKADDKPPQRPGTPGAGPGDPGAGAPPATGSEAGPHRPEPTGSGGG